MKLVTKRNLLIVGGSIIVCLILGFNIVIPIFTRKTGIELLQEFLEGDIDKNLNPTGDEPFNNTADLGWELLDNGSVIHAWNQFNDYYFNNSNGIQFSNHYEEYWTKNVLMLGYLTGNNLSDPDDWNLIYRTDELSGFTRNFEGETDSFMNLTLWKDLSYGSYDFRLAIRYHLGVNDSDLTIIPYIKNLGIEIPFTIGFGWELKDIKIDDNYENDQFRLEDVVSYSLHNDSLDEKYTNITFPYTDDEYTYDDEGNITQEWHNWTWRPNPIFYLDNATEFGYRDKTLYLKWNHTLDYLVWVKARQNQYNAPVSLFIKVGTLAVNQEKYTTLNWHDADVTYGTAVEFESGVTFDIQVEELAENKIIVAYCDASDGSAGKAVVGTVDTEDKSIAWGAIVEFASDVRPATFEAPSVDVCVLDTNKFVVCYACDVSDDDGVARVATVSGTTITFGNAKEFETGDTEVISCCKLDTDKFVVVYNDETNSDTATGVACTVNWALRKITYVGTPNDIATTDYFLKQGDVTQLETDKFVAVWAAYDGGIQWYGYAAVGTVSTRTITWGTPESIPAGNNLAYHLGVCSPDADKFVISFTGDDNDGYAVACTVDGYDIIWGTPYEFQDAVTMRLTQIAVIDSTHALIAYSPGIGYSCLLTIDWDDNSITGGTPEVFESGATSGGALDYGLGIANLSVTGDNHIAIVFQDDDDSDKGKAIIGQVLLVAPNNAPTQSGEVPANTSTGISLTPSLYVLCTDHDGNNMNATWSSNSSGSWVDFATNVSGGSGFANNTNITQTFTNATAYSTKYYWKVNLSDGHNGWDNETYHFTTEAEVRTWQIITNTTGWFIFQNSSVHTIIPNGSGWFSFQHSATHTTIPNGSGYFTFSNTSTNIIISNTSGWFSFSNETVSHTIVPNGSGWFTFQGINRVWVIGGNHTGWFSFANSPSHTSIPNATGWFSFSNTSTNNIISNTTGWFTFSNEMVTHTTIPNGTGWFSFRHSATHTIVPNGSGWFAFSNSSAHIIVPNGSGWFSFANDTVAHTIIPNGSGWFSFANSPSHTVIPNGSGWFSFQHSASHTIVPNGSGWFFFQNSSTHILIPNATGWFSFSAPLRTNQIIDNTTGWFSFQNSSSHTIIPNGSGWFSFASQLRVNQTIANASGWFSFANSSSHTVVPNGSGWFTFSNETVLYAIIPNGSGWFSFRGKLRTWQSPSNTTGYFTFGNATLLGISDIYPANGSADIPINVTLHFTVTSTFGYSMNITVYTGSNMSNCTALLGSFNSVGNGTYYIGYHNASEVSTEYAWKVNLSDGVDNYAQETYNFTTASTTGMIVFGPRGYSMAMVVAIAMMFVLLFPLIGIIWKKQKRRRYE